MRSSNLFICVFLSSMISLMSAYSKGLIHSCSAKPEKGDCKGYPNNLRGKESISYYFNEGTNSCQTFTYSGCAGIF